MIKAKLTGKKLDPNSSANPPSDDSSSAFNKSSSRSPGTREPLSRNGKESLKSNKGRVKDITPKPRVLSSTPRELNEQKMTIILRTAEANYMEESVAKVSAHKDRLNKLLISLESV